MVEGVTASRPSRHPNSGMSSFARHSASSIAFHSRMGASTRGIALGSPHISVRLHTSVWEKSPPHVSVWGKSPQCQSVRVSGNKADSDSTMQSKGEQCPSPSHSPILALPDLVLGANFPLVSAIWEIQIRWDLLSQLQGRIWHPQPELWKLWVWPIQGQGP